MTTLTKLPACLALVLSLGASAAAHASATLNYQFLSPNLPAGTRCLLVASTSDADFGQPGDLAGLSLSPGAVFKEDNLVLAVLTAEDLPGAITGCAGVLHLDYSAALDSGDPLRLYWLPGLDPAAQVIPLGSGFVDYRTDLAVDGATLGYLLPADGATESLYSIAVTYGGATTFPPSVPATTITFPAGQDSDVDGLDDLTEFAMGLDLYQSSTLDAPFVASANGGADLSYELFQRADYQLHGLLFTVETTNDLVGGTWLPTPLQPSAIPGKVEAIVPTPTPPNGRQFFRVKIEQQ